MRHALAAERRDPATGLAPAPLDGVSWDAYGVQDTIGTPDQCLAFDLAHGYDIDAVLAASAEFRRSVPGGAPFAWMSRGEAQHIVRALMATDAIASDNLEEKA